MTQEDDSRPSRLDELTTDFRLQQRELQRQGWRRNLLVAVGTLVVVFALYWLVRR